MNQKPKVFQNTISKKLNNNDACSITRSNEVYDSTNIETKINNIFKDKNYIYKADVIIKLKSGLIEKEIIGKKDDCLITLDNELIKIKDIIDIQRKN